ncbi:hypothetical protein HBH96_120150 [Parastagonospora nodorum]|nr:hypothetical protein HBI79_121770 [Parastagonospora nodorum]KAH5056198.1 hypothetical protein HBH96_120150 [Parastagonospora nodorum]KAH5694048.1 hypothetical protein HBI44_141130 [Parastagonospora nodorum]KAH6398692.1 hypothetical protein HBI60_100070 [Parastagonospora nodorum]
MAPVREETMVRDIPLSSRQYPEHKEMHDMFSVLSGNLYPASLNRSAELNDKWGHVSNGIRAITQRLGICWTQRRCN